MGASITSAIHNRTCCLLALQSPLLSTRAKSQGSRQLLAAGGSPDGTWTADPLNESVRCHRISPIFEGSPVWAFVTMASMWDHGGDDTASMQWPWVTQARTSLRWPRPSAVLPRLAPNYFGARQEPEF